jgi:hypothetical protein
MGYSKFSESLDADEPTGKPYTFRIQVAAGDSVTSATALEVESTSTQAAALSLVTISQQSLGLISGTLYGLTFRAQGKGVPGPTYVRCRFSTQLGAGDDITYRLDVTQR